MTETTHSNATSLKMVAGNQSATLLAESFLDTNYLFRRNVLSGKTEYLTVAQDEEWKILTSEAINSIVRRAKKMNIGGKKSPRQDIIEYLNSEDIPSFDPIREYLENLPQWDGNNHVANLFGRIPGLTSEQLEIGRAHV